MYMYVLRKHVVMQIFAQGETMAYENDLSGLMI